MNSATSGFVRFGDAAACDWRPRWGRRLEQLPHLRSPLVERVRRGANRRPTTSVQRSGTTLCFGDAALDAHHLERLAVLEPVDVTTSASCAARRASTAAARWIALRPIHGRAAWAAPDEPRLEHDHPWQPASTHPSVGSSNTAKSPARRSGRASNTCRSPLNSSAHLLALVERERHVVAWRRRIGVSPSASRSSTARPPFMSADPSPCSTSPVATGISLPFAGTVSR